MWKAIYNFVITRTYRSGGATRTTHTTAPYTTIRNATLSNEVASKYVFMDDNKSMDVALVE